jgi:hypothetical protein
VIAEQEPTAPADNCSIVSAFNQFYLKSYYLSLSLFCPRIFNMLYLFGKILLVIVVEEHPLNSTKDASTKQPEVCGGEILIFVQ